MAWQVEEIMPLDEFDGWCAYLKLKADLQKEALEKARREQKVASGVSRGAGTRGTPRPSAPRRGQAGTRRR